MEKTRSDDVLRNQPVSAILDGTGIPQRSSHTYVTDRNLSSLVDVNGTTSVLSSLSNVYGSSVMPSSHVQGSTGIPSSLSYAHGSTGLSTNLSHVYASPGLPPSQSYVHGTGLPPSQSYVHGSTGLPPSTCHVQGSTGILSSLSYVNGNKGLASSMSHVYESGYVPSCSTQVCSTSSTTHLYDTTGIPSSNVYVSSNTAVPTSVWQVNTRATTRDTRRTNELFNSEGILSEKQLFLKKSYGGYKGFLTRLYKEMEFAIASSNVEFAMDRKSRIEEVFDKLTYTYSQLIRTVPVEQQEAYVREQGYEVSRRNECLLSCQQWMSSLDYSSSRNQHLSSTAFISPSSGFTGLPSSLNHPKKLSTPSFPSYNDAEIKGARANDRNSPENSIKSVRTTSSRVSRTSAKAKVEKAQAKLRRLNEKKELERRLEEFHLSAEIEDAEIELKVLDEQDVDEELLKDTIPLPVQTKMDMVDAYVKSVSEHLDDNQEENVSLNDPEESKLPISDAKPQQTPVSENLNVDKLANNDNHVDASERDAINTQEYNVHITSESKNDNSSVSEPITYIRQQQENKVSKAKDDRTIIGQPTSTTTNDMHSPTLKHLLERQQDTMEQVVRNLSMPKREYMFFNGDPLIYPLFMKNFEVNVEQKESNAADRLNYLIQYCQGKAKEAIEHCMIMNPEEGYVKAKEILRKNFGRNHVVAKAFLDKVMKGPPIKINEGEKLSQLSRDMETCRLGLSQLGFEANLDSLDTLGKIVARLPVALKAKWAEKASQLYEQGATPKFSHLSKFIEDRAAVANTFFGQLIQDSKTDAKFIPKTKSISPTVKVTTLATSSMAAPNTADIKGTVKSPKCQLCGADHYLDQCQQFTSKNLEQRTKVIMDKRLCRLCLKYGHKASECKRSKMCGIDGCKGRHHSLLHSTKLEGSHNTTTYVPPPQVKTSASKPPDPTKAVNSVHCSALQTESSEISLKFVPVKVGLPDSDKVIETYAFLDDGSDATLCLRSLAEDLGAPCTPIDYVMSTMSGSEEKKSEIQLSLDVVGVSTGKGVRLERVLTTEKLSTCKNVLTNKELGSWQHLKDIDLSELSNKEVTILIGNDSPEALCPLEVKSGKKGEPYAVRTLLGWSVAGPLTGKKREVAHVNKIHVDQVLGCDQPETAMANIELQLEQMYNAEFTENSASVRECLSLEDRRAKTLMEQSVKFVDGHYQIDLPWKYDSVDLPDNRTMAERRVNLLKKRLQRDPELLKQYTTTMETYIDKGHAARVKEEEEESNGDECCNTWYLPHHPVVHPQKPGKVRVVFDCAATYGGKSLNNELLQGPDNTNSLVGVLLRFRQERVAIMSDVEQMFHQVYVTPKDRDALRFLWWPGGDISNDPVVYRMQVHLFGATSSPSVCSFALRKAAEDGKDEHDSVTVETVRNNFYVDDCLKSVPTVEEAIVLMQELTSLLAKKGFKLTKWISNEREVISQVPVHERAKSVDLDLEGLPTERVLGVKWNVESDTLGFHPGKETTETRRGILSFVASIYDPLGLAAPFLLPAKIVLQDLCRLKQDWDSSLPNETAEKWRDMKENVSFLINVEVPRCYKPRDFNELQAVEIHHFSDASTEGYGTASYLRVVDKEDRVHCSLLLGKSRVAPLKTVTVPRLELMAATVAAKVDEMIRQELRLPLLCNVIFWTDSMVVLRYILNRTKRFNTFVANRLQVIHDVSQPSQWRYVPSELNPADLASRGIRKDSSRMSREEALKFWQNGPEFLWQSETDWPTTPDEQLEVPVDDVEVKGSKQATAHVHTTSSVESKHSTLDDLIRRCSSWYHLCKLVAWLTRFKKYVNRRYGKSRDNVSKEPLTVQEVAQAEVDIVKLVQRDVFDADKRSGLKNLCPFIENGILRVGSRLERAKMDSTAKYPAILPSRHHITDLIVRDSHERNGHIGASQTLATTRQKYWIIKGLSTVRRILKMCIKCRRQHQRPATQLMAPLPKSRVTQGQPPFSAVGVDYFGPLNVKYRRGTTKRYGCVFTCMATRAIHIEVSSDLSTDSFVQAVTRFVSRRGPPKEMFSDNGTNFRGAEAEVKEALRRWNQDRIREKLRMQGIEWHFNAPAASHTGGVWERMIRTTRKILRAIVGKKLLDDETLATALCEVEKIINDRPLVKASSDPNDLEALTPSSLLLLRQNSSVSPLTEQTSVKLKERRRAAQEIADSFWERWIAEYLPTLHERQKWLKPRRNIAEGDLVLISDDNVARGNWPLGIVTETFPDSKGFVRHAMIRTAKGTYRRNIQKLCLLEAANEF